MILPSWIPSSLPSHLRTSQHRNSIPSSAHIPTNMPSRQRQSVASEHSFLCLAEKHKRPLRKVCSMLSTCASTSFTTGPPGIATLRFHPGPSGTPNHRRRRLAPCQSSLHTLLYGCLDPCLRGSRAGGTDVRGRSTVEVNERVCSLKRVDPATTASRSTDRDGFSECSNDFSQRLTY